MRKYNFDIVYQEEEQNFRMDFVKVPSDIVQIWSMEMQANLYYFIEDLKKEQIEK